MTRLLIISDQSLFRHALARVLTEDEPVLTVNEAASAEEAFEQIQIARPDVILVHAGRSISSAMQFLRELQEKTEDIPAILLLNQLDDNMMRIAIQAGISGCVDTSIDARRLLQAFRDALNGDIAISDGLARRLARMLANGNGHNGNGRNGSAHKNDTFVEMPTTRELQVLTLVSAGLTNNEIADRLAVSESTVRAHLRTTAEKLNARNRSHAVARAISLGLIDGVEAEN